MKNVKDIPIRNYILLGIVIIISMAIVIYFYMWYRMYEVKKMNSPIMDEYLQVLHYNELDNYLLENKEAVVYVSILGDTEIRDFEKKFKRLISKYSLNNDILYLDITDELKNSKLYDEIKNNYGIVVPYIIVFKNGNVVSKFNIRDNNYNTNLLKDYFMNEGIIDD